MTVLRSVGLRNYRFFCGFITSVFSLTIVVAVECFIFMSDYSRNLQSSSHSSSTPAELFFEQAIKDNPLQFSLGLVCAMTSLSLFGLIAYHVNLMRKGETTNEAIRAVYRRNINPYNRSFFANAYTLLWEPLPPSLLSFLTEPVREGSVPGMSESVASMQERRNFGGEGNREADIADPNQQAHQAQQLPHSYQQSDSTGGSDVPASGEYYDSHHALDVENPHEDDPRRNLLSTQPAGGYSIQMQPQSN